MKHIQFQSTAKVTRLPVEITREIFICLLNIELVNNIKSNEFIIQKQQEGILDLLNVAMVCKSWYFICLELMKSKLVNSISLYQKSSSPWLPLINYACFQRSFPFRSKLVNLLQESHWANLIFHQQVKDLVIDFASFDTTHRKRIKSNRWVEEKVHHPEALRNTLKLFELCTQVKRLDIIFDAGFTSLLSHDVLKSNTKNKGPNMMMLDQHHEINNNYIISTSKLIADKIIQQNKSSEIKELCFTGFNPIQRCPCCAGKGWDQYLYPIIQSLDSLEVLILKNVLPSAQVFDQLSKIPSLKKIVFYKSMITVPNQRKVKSNTGLTTSVNQIPYNLWNQFKSIEIYEDIEDVTTWRTKRYLTELVDHLGSQLEHFVLQFGTNEEINHSLNYGHQDNRSDPLFIQDLNSPLQKLKSKCKSSLKQILLINVPLV